MLCTCHEGAWTGVPLGSMCPSLLARYTADTLQLVIFWGPHLPPSPFPLPMPPAMTPWWWGWGRSAAPRCTTWPGRACGWVGGSATLAPFPYQDSSCTATVRQYQHAHGLNHSTFCNPHSVSSCCGCCCFSLSLSAVRLSLHSATHAHPAGCRPGAAAPCGARPGLLPRPLAHHTAGVLRGDAVRPAAGA